MVPVDMVSEIEQSAWFQAPESPYLLIDTDLRIRAVNRAHSLASGQPEELTLGARVFEAFPDNPADPDANGVEVICDSIEQVFRSGNRHNIGVQRYDVPDRQRPGAFIHKVWVPVNSPIKIGGRTVAVLNHAQDVTAVLSPSDTRPGLAELVQAAATLKPAFPTLPDAEVLGVLTHSHAVVLDSVGTPDLERATALARLRLEVRFGCPAVC